MADIFETTDAPADRTTPWQIAMTAAEVDATQAVLRAGFVAVDFGLDMLALGHVTSSTWLAFEILVA
ncbi:MAG: hypothetical protein ABI832_00430 [bacterium]